MLKFLLTVMVEVALAALATAQTDTKAALSLAAAAAAQPTAPALKLSVTGRTAVAPSKLPDCDCPAGGVCTCGPACACLGSSYDSPPAVGSDEWKRLPKDAQAYQLRRIAAGDAGQVTIRHDAPALKPGEVAPGWRKALPGETFDHVRLPDGRIVPLGYTAGGPVPVMFGGCATGSCGTGR